VKFNLIEIPFLRSIAWRLGRKLYFWARHDIENDLECNGEYLLLRKLISSNRLLNPVFLDVGANIGDWTEQACSNLNKYAFTGKIHASEPAESTFSYLSNRFKGCKMAHTHRVALSNQTSQKDFFVVEPHSGINSLIKISGASIERVQTLKIDDLLIEEKIDYVYFIKSDTEGHDFSVIQGAAETLAQGKVEIWQFEYNHRWVEQRSFLKDVFDFISDKPYKLGKIYGNGIEIYQKWHPELERFIEGNYVLIKRGSMFEKIAHEVIFDARNVAVTV
jgi:FkbM family methyltransferase